MRLILSTRNEHKLREFRVLLEPHELVPLPDDVALPPETGDTFEENARAARPRWLIASFSATFSSAIVRPSPRSAGTKAGS